MFLTKIFISSGTIFNVEQALFFAYLMNNESEQMCSMIWSIWSPSPSKSMYKASILFDSFFHKLFILWNFNFDYKKWRNKLVYVFFVWQLSNWLWSPKRHREREREYCSTKRTKTHTQTFIYDRTSCEIVQIQTHTHSNTTMKKRHFVVWWQRVLFVVYFHFLFANKKKTMNFWDKKSNEIVLSKAVKNCDKTIKIFSSYSNTFSTLN